jgi:hypothetical protein
MHEADPQVIALLTEIRDNQREPLRHYQETAGRSIALQQQAVARQKRFMLINMLIVLPVPAAVLALLIYLLQRYI